MVFVLSRELLMSRSSFLGLSDSLQSLLSRCIVLLSVPHTEIQIAAYDIICRSVNNNILLIKIRHDDRDTILSHDDTILSHDDTILSHDDTILSHDDKEKHSSENNEWKTTYVEYITI